MTINFAAGPAKVPEEVLRKAQQEFLDFNNTGISVTELSHRSSHFAGIISKVEASVRRVLNVPDNYAVLFMHGGGVGQMAAAPMNLCGSSENVVHYVLTGSWSEKAAKEAEKYCKVTKTKSAYTQVTPVDQWNLSPETKYVYYCDNETVHGVEFDEVPDTKSIPIVCDMTSNLFTRPVDVTKFGCIFAATQKNAGIAGLTIVIVRKDLISPLNITPSVFDYNVTIKNGSLQNTPCCFAIYVAGLCLDWIESKGGLEKMAEHSLKKSSLIYEIIDESNGYYHNPVEKKFRSRVNIPFRVGGPIGNIELEKKFLQEAEKLGMIQLKGHRSVGGIRASLYNAVTIDEVTTLANFMKKFMKENPL